MNEQHTVLSQFDTCCTRERPPVPEHWRPLNGTPFEIDVQFIPGYNCHRPDGGHGVSGMKIYWYLRGPKGVVQFAVYTSWTPGELRPGHGLSPSGNLREVEQYPNGFDLGYHARVPQYEGQPAMSCDLLPEGQCFYDGSGLNADRLARRFTEDGEQAIWDTLIEWYDELVHPEQGGSDATAD